MARKILIMVACLSVFGILFLGFHVPAGAGEDVIRIKKKKTGTSDVKKMIITRHTKGEETISVEVAGKLNNIPDNSVFQTGLVTDSNWRLVLRGPVTVSGNTTMVDMPIIDIPDDIFIETEGSECTWYFFLGRWWRICN